jgi:hypothetical protein
VPLLNTTRPPSCGAARLPATCSDASKLPLYMLRSRSSMPAMPAASPSAGSCSWSPAWPLLLLLACSSGRLPRRASAPLGPTRASSPATARRCPSRLRLPLSCVTGCLRKLLLRLPLLKEAEPVTSGAAAGPLAARLTAALPPPQVMPGARPVSRPMPPSFTFSASAKCGSVLLPLLLSLVLLAWSC